MAGVQQDPQNKVHVITENQMTRLRGEYDVWVRDKNWSDGARAELRILRSIPYAVWTILLVAIASPLAILAEDVATRFVGQGSGAPGYILAAARFSHCIALVVLTALITGWMYTRYCAQIGDKGWRGAFVIGGAPAAAGFVSMLMFTPETFQAISANNWKPFGPHTEVNLFTYLVFSRLVLLPAVGTIVCVALYASGPASRDRDGHAVADWDRGVQRDGHRRARVATEPAQA